MLLCSHLFWLEIVGGIQLCLLHMTGAATAVWILSYLTLTLSSLLDFLQLVVDYFICLFFLHLHILISMFNLMLSCMFNFLAIAKSSKAISTNTKKRFCRALTLFESLFCLTFWFWSNFSSSIKRNYFCLNEQNSSMVVFKYGYQISNVFSHIVTSRSQFPWFWF